eukprot:CAMPEP_0116831678 /NCGR_PEP_ID=MMETSP0418-20121206/5474_1 /TAXON_ID=1158023 /ORGANISM="Astrosyne radiata, Strain 13vi08-1A" /LENGTH=352 /DNA_ID=CAMNT_0004460963 /DNA_START=107 /DNA_END=1165 /DNA_ORIENTATION=-
MTESYTFWGKTVQLGIPKSQLPSLEVLEKWEDEVMPTPHEHGWFESNGRQLHYRKWLPSDDKKPKAIVVYMHGIASHGGNACILEGRKLNVALSSDYMTKQGYAFYALDMAGHGYSEGLRFYIPTWQSNRDDLANFCHSLSKEANSELPLFLCGESYGACLCLHVAKLWQDDPTTKPKLFGGLGLMAPAIIGDLPPAPVVFVLRYMLAPIFPAWIPFFMPNPINPDRIWKDKAVLQAQLESKAHEWGLDASGSPFCLQTAVNLLEALENVREVTIPALNTPFCVMHGTSDYGVPMEGTKYLEEHAKTPENERDVWYPEGAYHDLLGDPVAEQVIARLAAFFDKRLDEILKTK